MCLAHGMTQLDKIRPTKPSNFRSPLRPDQFMTELTEAKASFEVAEDPAGDESQVFVGET